MEISPGTSGYQDRRNPAGFKQIPCPFDKRSDRFLIPVNDSLHQFIPHHKVGGAGVLVDEQKFRSTFHRLHHICRLRSASAGVFRIKCLRIFPAGQVVDKHGNICLLDAPPILRADFHSRVVGDHILSSIPRDMVIDAKLQRFQQCGFSMISASGNQRDSLTDSHSADRPAVGQLHRHLHGFRGLERHAGTHRSLGHAGFSRQYGTIGNKRTQPHLR